MQKFNQHFFPSSALTRFQCLLDFPFTLGIDFHFLQLALVEHPRYRCIVVIFQNVNGAAFSPLPSDFESLSGPSLIVMLFEWCFQLRNSNKISHLESVPGPYFLLLSLILFLSFYRNFAGE